MKGDVILHRRREVKETEPSEWDVCGYGFFKSQGRLFLKI